MKTHLFLVLFVAVTASLFTSAPASAASRLRYAFEPGRKYVYDVKIGATLPEAVETREGLGICTVKSAADEHFTLRCNPSLTTRRQATTGQPMLGRPHFPPHFPWSDNVFARPGDFTISSLGGIIKTTGGTALPYMLGDLEFLVIEELPADAA